MTYAAEYMDLFKERNQVIKESCTTCSQRDSTMPVTTVVEKECIIRIPHNIANNKRYSYYDKDHSWLNN